jgi:hypothetical protein
MKTKSEHQQIHGVINVIDSLLDFKLNSQEFMSNEKIVLQIGETIDRLNAVEYGHSLLSITKGKTRNLLLITKNNNWFHIYKWIIEESIEKVVGVEIHEENHSADLHTFLEKLEASNQIRTDELMSALVVPTINGFNTNKKAATDFVNLKNKDERKGPSPKEEAIAYRKENEGLISFGRKVLSKIAHIKSELKKTIETAVQKFEIKELELTQEFNNLKKDKIFLGEITDVKEIGGRRHFEIKWVSVAQSNNNLRYGRLTHACSSGVESVSIINSNDLYIYIKRDYDYDNAEFNVENLEYIPYNLVDKGRLIAAIKDTDSEWKILISQDPRVDAEFSKKFEKGIIEYINERIELGHSILGTEIKVPSLKAVIPYDAYEHNQRKLNENLSGIRLKLKSLKVMVDEHNYIVKKNSSIGEDVTVTDSIKFNHQEGKIAYNDFSIAIPDEYVKAKLYNLFNSYLMKYYRSEATEQDILDSLITDVFTAISERLNNSTKTDLELPIRINDNINIIVTGKISKRYAKNKEGEKTDTVASTGQLFYINDQRFNKNEVLMVLREMTCYRSQEEADAFINNIGRLSLSSYIGITTGYEINFNTDSRSSSKGEPQNRLFRFKKIKGGRSNFQLILDDTSIPIKGKKLINILYENFIGERVPDFLGKIPNFIYECSGSSLQYLKYRVLIDESYKAFKDKSIEYLNKKVKELGASHAKYFNKKARKIMDAILLKGASGKTYIIAYDSKDSFVFMDPQLNETEEPSEIKQYKEGKYICMIDQSNIKSNISHDTIVSKLMALKNDSSIAHTIYNLQEELE